MVGIVAHEYISAFQSITEREWPRADKTFFILNSAEYGIYPAHKC